jgi:hypothetical protein
MKLNLSQNIILKESNDFDQTALVPFSTKRNKKINDPPESQDEEKDRNSKNNEEERKRHLSSDSDPEEIS